jgi:hypothetical protein
MTKNDQLVEARLQELLQRACNSSIYKTIEIKQLTSGIEITVDGLVTTAVLRAAVSLQECYPKGGVYVASRMGRLVLCIYYEMED